MRVVGIFATLLFATANVVAVSISANLGYSTTNQMAVTKDTGLNQAVFTDVTPGAGVIFDTRAGVSTAFDNAFTPDFDGSRGYRGFLSGSGSVAAAIASNDYIQFALTLSSSEVASLDSIIISGLAGSVLADTYRLYVSTNGFASVPADTDYISEATFPLFSGGASTDAANPLVGVGLVDFSPVASLVLPAGTTTYTFRLYINDAPSGDAQGFEMDKIVFGMTAEASLSLMMVH